MLPYLWEFSRSIKFSLLIMCKIVASGIPKFITVLCISRDDLNRRSAWSCCRSLTNSDIHTNNLYLLFRHHVQYFQPLYWARSRVGSHCKSRKTTLESRFNKNSVTRIVPADCQPHLRLYFLILGIDYYNEDIWIIVLKNYYASPPFVAGSIRVNTRLVLALYRPIRAIECGVFWVNSECCRWHNGNCWKLDNVSEKVGRS